MRLRVRRPGWLVYGQSFSEGWRAACDGRDLGRPVPLQGYANAWPVRPGCRSVALTFAPNRLLTPFYLLSLLACAVLAAVAARVRRRRGTGGEHALAPLVEDAPRPMSPRRAVLVALPVAAALAFGFGVRAGPAALVLLAVVLARPVPSRVLTAVALGLLAVVVPALYALDVPRDRGGYAPGFAEAHGDSHWVVLTALVLLAVTGWRAVSTASGRRDARADGSPGSDAPRSAP